MNSNYKKTATNLDRRKRKMKVAGLKQCHNTTAGKEAAAECNK